MHGREVSRGIAKGILSRYLTRSPKYMGVHPEITMASTTVVAGES
jgi:hypothetical protein